MNGDYEKIHALTEELEHASAIADCAIGQPDRAEAVAHREYVRSKLQRARVEEARKSADEANS
jgi:hypothetical protein